MPVRSSTEPMTADDRRIVEQRLALERVRNGPPLFSLLICMIGGSAVSGAIAKSEHGAFFVVRLMVVGAVLLGVGLFMIVGWWSWRRPGTMKRIRMLREELARGEVVVTVLNATSVATTDVLDVGHSAAIFSVSDGTWAIVLEDVLSFIPDWPECKYPGRMVIRATPDGEVVHVDTSGDVLPDPVQLSPEQAAALRALWVQADRSGPVQEVPSGLLK